jgi:hypothetical protein
MAPALTLGEAGGLSELPGSRSCLIEAGFGQETRISLYIGAMKQDSPFGPCAFMQD